MHRFAALFVCVALATPIVAGSDSPPAFRWPDTPAGRHAAAWFEAFNTGEPAMRKFFAGHVSAEGFQRRPLDERLSVYRSMHETRGRLDPLTIAPSSDTELRVIAKDASGERIALSFLSEPGGAFAGVRIEDLPGEEDTSPAHERPEGAASLGGPPMTESDVAAALRARLDSLSRADVFSGAALIVHGHRVLLRDAWGLASREKRIPNRPDTKFNLGSINKIFTRVAIEQLSVAGTLRLDDTIDRYLPDYPADKGRRITIRQLLEHRAGTGDVFNARFDQARAGLHAIGDWVNLIRDQPLDFEPGTRQEYSNAGYVLLGAIIEKVSGETYFDYVRAHIFEPAGMHGTDSWAVDASVPNRATGYTRRGGGAWQPNTGTLPARGSSAGGGYSTLDDLRRFAEALSTGRLGIPSEAALGIAGGAPGINAALEITKDYIAVVLANQDPPAAEREAERIRGWMARAGLGGPSRERRILRAGHGPSSAMQDRPQHTLLPAEPVEVPMLHSGHLAAVDVMVNGRGPYRFAIDTGAAGTARIDSSLAASLGLPVVGEVMSGDPSGRNGERRPVVAIDSITIGGARFAGLTAASRTNPAMMRGEHIDGILGFALFSDCLFTLDYPADRIRIAAGALPPADGAEVLDFTMEHGIPGVALRVAGLDLTAHVDAGSMGGFSLPESLAARLPLAAKPKVVAHARTVSNTFDVLAAPLDATIELGRWHFDHPVVEFQPVFAMANIGSRVLKDFRVTFDIHDQRMRLERSTTTTGPLSR
jgi:CubicO group peptidase (beta-lactamase class C family)